MKNHQDIRDFFYRKYKIREDNLKREEQFFLDRLKEATHGKDIVISGWPNLTTNDIIIKLS